MMNYRKVVYEYYDKTEPFSEPIDRKREESGENFWKGITRLLILLKFQKLINTVKNRVMENSYPIGPINLELVEDHLRNLEL